MKISYLWLRDYIDVAASPEELRDVLSSVGLVVESVQTAGDDTILDLEIPSNRPDCLSHTGIARELAAVYNLDLKIPSPRELRGEGRFPVRIEAPELCRRYSAQAIRGVKIAPSPEWMQRRLAAAGQRPINNIVDVTNYVLLELGHPLHAFDLSRLMGPEIVVRTARPGETLRTLDGVERRLGPGHLVIADASRPVALAGIMGGEHSEINPASTELLIESAYFDPACIGRTARALQVRTEASHRFERGANQEATLRALKRCVELIVDLAGGTVSTPVIDVVTRLCSLPVVPLRRQKMQRYSIIEIPDGFVRRTLSRLEFQVEGNSDGWMVTVPNHRADVSLEEDLIEEVLRHYGYDRIPSALPRWSGKGELLPETECRHRLAEMFRALGYSETLNWTLADPDLEKVFGYRDSPVVLKNPLSVEASQLRTHLLPNLLLAARHNRNHG
ncbi:MAG: phenylalanine--tRNA ligase subunit beta, partial [Acidobacteria bacterium]|nr:phenylalanine--tRNA ligase subunit beta [Acidobacteriota bacterium]